VEFGNPIVGQENLIRSAIKSPDFNTDPESGNVTGWRIARDGSATFYDLTIGSTNFTIDKDGNAVFKSVSADDIFLNGERLGDTLGAMPRGIFAVNTSSADLAASVGGDPVEFNSISISNWDSTRQYRVGVIARINAQTACTYVRIACHYAWNSLPNTNSPLLFELQDSRGTYNTDTVLTGSIPVSDSAQQGSTLNLRFYCNCDNQGIINYQGTAYGRVWVEDVGPLVVYGQFTPTKPPVQQYTKTYTAQWSESYSSNGASRGSYANGNCFQGYYSSTNGNQFSLVGLPESTIASDLAGATVIKTEIYLQNEHWFSADGGTVYVGTHTYANAPSNASSSNYKPRMSSGSFSYGQGRWFTVSNSLANDFKTNGARGIVIGPAPSNSQNYYGFFSGAAESRPPKMRITYSK